MCFFFFLFFTPQLRSAEEEASQRKRWAEATDPAAKEKFQRIDKEIKEQEILIKGYQQVCLPELSHCDCLILISSTLLLNIYCISKLYVFVLLLGQKFRDQRNVLTLLGFWDTDSCDLAFIPSYCNFCFGLAPHETGLAMGNWERIFVHVAASESITEVLA